MFAFIFITITIIALIYENLKEKSFNRDSKREAKEKGQYFWIDYNGGMRIGDKKVWRHTRNGHDVIEDFNGNILRDFTREKDNIAWEKYRKEYKESKAMALERGRDAIVVYYPHVGLIKIELSTGKRIRTDKVALKGIKPCYYKYYYDSMEEESSWLDNRIEITAEEYSRIC